jgi:hypothetical protein
MNSVGTPAPNPRVRVDERGRETGRLAKCRATAPFLDSTVTSDGAASYETLKNAIDLSHAMILVATGAETSFEEAPIRDLENESDTIRAHDRRAMTSNGLKNELGRYPGGQGIGFRGRY